MSDTRAVILTVPARPDHLVLARLALSAVCRLTQLQSEDVSDLKLALTEAAGGMVNEEGEVRFCFELGEESLLVRITGGKGAEPEQDELSRAIVAATVDEYAYAEDEVRLVKYLTDPDE